MENAFNADRMRLNPYQDPMGKDAHQGLERFLNKFHKPGVPSHTIITDPEYFVHLWFHNAIGNLIECPYTKGKGYHPRMDTEKTKQTVKDPKTGKDKEEETETYSGMDFDDVNKEFGSRIGIQSSGTDTTLPQYCLDLTPFVREATLPEIAPAGGEKITTLFGETTAGAFSPYASDGSKPITLQMIDTEYSILDAIFYPWMKDINSPWWYRPDKVYSDWATPYPMATLEVYRPRMRYVSGPKEGESRDEGQQYQYYSYRFIGVKPTSYTAFTVNAGGPTNLLRSLSLVADMCIVDLLSDAHITDASSAHIGNRTGFIFSDSPPIPPPGANDEEPPADDGLDEDLDAAEKEGDDLDKDKKDNDKDIGQQEDGDMPGEDEPEWQDPDDPDYDPDEYADPEGDDEEDEGEGDKDPEDEPPEEPESPESEPEEGDPIDSQPTKVSSEKSEDKNPETPMKSKKDTVVKNPESEQPKKIEKDDDDAGTPVVPESLTWAHDMAKVKGEPYTLNGPDKMTIPAEDLFHAKTDDEIKQIKSGVIRTREKRRQQIQKDYEKNPSAFTVTVKPDGTVTASRRIGNVSSGRGYVERKIQPLKLMRMVKREDVEESPNVLTEDQMKQIDVLVEAVRYNHGIVGDVSDVVVNPVYEVAKFGDSVNCRMYDSILDSQAEDVRESESDMGAITKDTVYDAESEFFDDVSKTLDGVGRNILDETSQQYGWIAKEDLTRTNPTTGVGIDLVKALEHPVDKARESLGDNVVSNKALGAAAVLASNIADSLGVVGNERISGDDTLYPGDQFYNVYSTLNDDSDLGLTAFGIVSNATKEVTPTGVIDRRMYRIFPIASTITRIYDDAISGAMKKLFTPDVGVSDEQMNDSIVIRKGIMNQIIRTKDAAATVYDFLENINMCQKSIAEDIGTIGVIATSIADSNSECIGTLGEIVARMSRSKGNMPTPVLAYTGLLATRNPVTGKIM